MTWRRGLVLFLPLVLLSGCATIPAGPSVMVLPAQGKSFETFQVDDTACRQWALQQTGAAPSDVVHQNLAGGAAIGTLMGAGLGAAIGSAYGNAGAGAAIGAGSGLLLGTGAATGPAYAAGWEVQKRYDLAYQQCMYAKGNKIPGFVGASRQPYWVPPPPPPGYPSGSPVPYKHGPYPPPPQP